MPVDFGLRSQDYATHRPGFPASFFSRIEQFTKLNGATALDVGTGPAIVALELARRGALVTGIDKSEQQIEWGRRRVAEAGLDDRCRLEVASAEATGVEDASCDIVTAGQCWGWFDEPAACREVRRVLRPGGWLVVAQYCYLPRLCPIAGASEKLVLEYNPTWEHADFDGLYPQRIDALINGGFDLVEQFCYDEDRACTHESWRGRMRTCNGVGSGGMTTEDVERFDADHARMLAEQFPEEPLMIRHRIWSVVARCPMVGGRP